jgi:dihydroorotase-like cyclic amidohydrolase
VHPGKITLARMVELFTTGPESIMRLGRGTLAPGAPADVTIFSTDLELDLRREPVVLPQPQFPVPRTDLPRRPGSHHRQRSVIWP